MEFYELLKREIMNRFEGRSKECVDIDDAEKLRLAQGAARELGAIVDFMELMENPPSKDGEQTGQA